MRGPSCRPPVIIRYILIDIKAVCFFVSYLHEEHIFCLNSVHSFNSIKRYSFIELKLD